MLSTAIPSLSARAPRKLPLYYAILAGLLSLVLALTGEAQGVVGSVNGIVTDPAVPPCDV